MRYLWLPLALMLACSDETLVEDEPLPTFEPEPGGLRPYVGGEEMQGRSLLGNLADSFSSGPRFIYGRPVDAIFRGAPATVSVVSGTLRVTSGNVTYAGELLEGLHIKTQGTGYLRVKDVALGDPAEGIRESYELEFLTSLNATPQPYCQTDEDHEPFATVLQGEWTRQRVRLVTDKMSFACVGRGVADKCLRFGYDPRSDTSGDMFDAYQACTQAASATICGDGVPHTYDETPIRIRDFIDGGNPEPSVKPALIPAPSSPWPPDPDTIYFESAWIPGSPVPCLSALRWLSLPPGPKCGGALPDPRVPPEGPGAPVGRFCEDISYQDLRSMGAKIFIGSMTMDKGLYQWMDSSDRQVTTSLGYASEVETRRVNGVDLPVLAAPFGDYKTLAANPFDGFLLRNLPGSLDAATDMVPVFVQTNDATQDTLIWGSTPVTNGHSVGDHEGWIFRLPRPGMVAFRRWRRGDDYTSGTRPPPGNWQPGPTLGYVMPP